MAESVGRAFLLCLMRAQHTLKVVHDFKSCKEWYGALSPPIEPVGPPDASLVLASLEGTSPDHPWKSSSSLFQLRPELGWPLGSLPDSLPDSRHNLGWPSVFSSLGLSFPMSTTRGHGMNDRLFEL